MGEMVDTIPSISNKCLFVGPSVRLSVYPSACPSVSASFSLSIGSIFSSPEPKAHGELKVYLPSRRLSMCLCVHIFKHEYL